MNPWSQVGTALTLLHLLLTGTLICTTPYGLQRLPRQNQQKGLQRLPHHHQQKGGEPSDEDSSSQQAAGSRQHVEHDRSVLVPVLALALRLARAVVPVARLGQ